MRLTLIGAGLALAMLHPAQAQTPPTTPPESARFTMQPVEGGLMKLDTTTGAMSFCAAKAGGSGVGAWVCEAVPEDRAALEAEISRLQGRIAALEKGRAGTGTGGTGTGVPDIMAPPSAEAPKDMPLGPPDEPAAKPAPKSDQELSDEARERLDQAMDMVEQVFRRFFDMVDRLRREEGAQDQKL